ncbi:hypothetical protein INR49_012383, partial [Caranx melampygus]
MSLVISSDISVSLLSLVVTACGLALFGVSLFVSWKLCWIPWRERGLSPTTKEAHGHLNPTMSPLPSQPTPRQPVYTAVDPPTHNRRESSQCSITREPTLVASVVGPSDSSFTTTRVMATPEAAMKISHTSPDIPLDAQSKSRENGVHTNPRMQRQTTEPPPSGRSMSEIGISELQYGMFVAGLPHGMGLGLGRLKPELYKQRSLEGDEGSRRGGGCGRLHFILKFDCDLDQLIVKIHKAEDLPARTSLVPLIYVKIYLLPDRKTKHQTKDNVDLGDLMFSLCYLPTAGRLTITMIKARNLKAMISLVHL